MQRIREYAFATAMVALLLLPGGPVAAADFDRKAEWPEFHGPGRTNISHETGLMKKWPEGGPRLVWKFSDCGEGYSGVSIAKEMIFTAGDFRSSRAMPRTRRLGTMLVKSDPSSGEQP